MEGRKIELRRKGREGETKESRKTKQMDGESQGMKKVQKEGREIELRRKGREEERQKKVEK